MCQVREDLIFIYIDRFLWNEGEKNGREGFRLTAKDHLPRGLTRLQQREIQTATKEWQSLETCGLIWTERCLHKFIILTIHNIMGEIQKSPVFCFGLKAFKGGGGNFVLRIILNRHYQVSLSWNFLLLTYNVYYEQEISVCIL